MESLGWTRWMPLPLRSLGVPPPSQWHPGEHPEVASFAFPFFCSGTQTSTLKTQRRRRTSSRPSTSRMRNSCRAMRRRRCWRWGTSRPLLTRAPLLISGRPLVLEKWLGLWAVPCAHASVLLEVHEHIWYGWSALRCFASS